MNFEHSNFTNMKRIKFSLIFFAFLHITCFTQDFSIGWANLGTRFIPINNELNYSNFDILTPGFELQLSYHYNYKWSIKTGANYQSLYFRSPIQWHSDNLPPVIASSFDKAICIPVLIKYNFLKTGTSTRAGITTGIYFASPLYHQGTYYSSGNPEISGDERLKVNYYKPYRYSYMYLGFGITKTISLRYEIYAEPFACNILKEVRDGSLVTQKYRNNFWYGIKVGINYLFKIKKHEN